MAKAVRLSDIAERLKVSTVTVSKALSGQKGVSEEHRALIIRTAEDMGYIKKAAAAAKSSYTIGVVVAERYVVANQSFYWDIYQDISRYVVQKNSFAILELIAYEDEKNKKLPKMVIGSKVDAVILMGTFSHEYTEFLLSSISLPMLCLDTISPDENVDSVVSNNMMGGYHMTNYLFELGHRKIGFVGTRLATNSIDDRFFGYLKSCMEHGMSFRMDWVLDDRERERGEFCIDEVRLPEDMPTAFFCNCDIAAVRLADRLVREGYRVPEDISIVGFDNYLQVPRPDLKLTTYEINSRAMGSRAGHIILHKLHTENYTTGIYVLPGRFIEGSSAVRIGAPVPRV